ncbi:hypothetical protein WH47_02653 [Habropoda laboriosa]|uniref:Secreted protein n=1 Tax=Habropoda laboriosa TaxID=597456 RepID=A0A0L7QX77_9HYME|nr:PREDICTED: uncharacterized protein LOC108574309 [Habropoda laboriosa]XP_017792366.1 PREDICTED: uncharacterized protein LOC108574309 [Habropoda laboriosa]KOC63144.1 hypothetical protein WH47_02653 [Habropoda laboriosa]
MKQILAVLLLLSVVNAVFTWEKFHTGIFDKHFAPYHQFTQSDDKIPPSGWFHRPPEHRQPPPENSFIPPGHRQSSPEDSFIPPGYRYIPPGHVHDPPGQVLSTSCQLLDQLVMFQVNQQMAMSKSCTVAWICQNPETNDMVITGVNGAQIVIQKHPNKCSDENPGQTCINEKEPNSETSKTPPSTIRTTTPQPKVTDSIRHSGEGIIDVRSRKN